MPEDVLEMSHRRSNYESICRIIKISNLFRIQECYDIGSNSRRTSAEMEIRIRIDG